MLWKSALAEVLDAAHWTAILFAGISRMRTARLSIGTPARSPAKALSRSGSVSGRPHRSLDRDQEPGGAGSEARGGREVA